MLISACGDCLSPKFCHKFLPNNFLCIFIMVWLLSLFQVTSVMSFWTNTHSVFALNANGLVHPGKIAHVNTAIRARRLHLFVISETKTNSNMGNKLLKDNYNIFEETGVKTENHHLYKWGIVVGIHKELQISQQITLTHSALRGHAIAIDLVLGSSLG